MKDEIEMLDSKFKSNLNFHGTIRLKTYVGRLYVKYVLAQGIGRAGFSAIHDLLNCVKEATT